MPRGKARCTDTWVGVCCCHPPIPCIPMSGYIVECSSDVTTEKQGQARCFDTVIGYCGHTGMIDSCSATINVNNKGAARLRDSVSGCTIGNIDSSAEKTFGDDG